MPSEDTEKFEFIQYQKSDKAQCIIYSDFECLIGNIDGSENNPNNPNITKVGKHIPSGVSMSTILSFKSIGSKHDVYRGKDYMKKNCESLRKHAMEINTINMR